MVLMIPCSTFKQTTSHYVVIAIAGKLELLIKKVLVYGEGLQRDELGRAIATMLSFILTT
jgi:hypothetical protein